MGAGPVPDHRHPGATDTFAFDINNRGEITLQGMSAEEPLYDFVRRRRRLHPVQFPGVGATRVRKVDDRGRVVGVYGLGATDQLGFTLKRGRYRSIDFPGDGLTGVNSSNARGTVVGYVIEGDPLQPDAVRGASCAAGG